MKVSVTTEKDGQEYTVEGELTTSWLSSERFKTITIECDDYKIITIKEIAKQYAPSS